MNFKNEFSIIQYSDPIDFWYLADLNIFLSERFNQLVNNNSIICNLGKLDCDNERAIKYYKISQLIRCARIKSRRINKRMIRPKREDYGENLKAFIDILYKEKLYFYEAVKNSKPLTHPVK